MLRQGPFLEARGVSLYTPSGRPLILDLEMRLERERVAVVGRNGVGKSSLVEVLSGASAPHQGRICCSGTRRLVRQQLVGGMNPAGVPGSPGETRRWLIEEARRADPDFLFLDEPSQDLDDSGISWLRAWIARWERGLVVVTHDRRILRSFSNFFVVTENGCRLISGSLERLTVELERERVDANRKYAARLSEQVAKEEHNSAIRRRRARKKAGGRVRELDRCPARIRLNGKKSYAQVYQGKREGVREARIAAVRAWTHAARRALSVELPLDLEVPALPRSVGLPIVELDRVGVSIGERVLFADVSLSVERERLGIVGPNGAGKTTLLEILAGREQPGSGRAKHALERLGYVAQHADNWRIEYSLIELLYARTGAETLADAVEQLIRHRFPLALGERPLNSLSPGERTRAALICLFARHPPVELLLLDEPTDQLDLVGIAALETALKAWPGGLVVVSHDREFLENIGVTTRIELGRVTTLGDLRLNPAGEHHAREGRALGSSG